MKRQVWSDRDLHGSGYKKPVSQFDPWVATSRMEGSERLKIELGCDSLLRAIHREHPAIMQAHQRAGRNVRWP